jgi:hypothetical protein
LTAADTGGSGVASTWYQLDGGAWTAGTSVAVAAPASGSAPHTIKWYSIDVATNQEVTKNVAFTVAAPVVADTAPPTTTSSFNPAAGAVYKSAQAVTLTPSDTGGSGLKTTYYKIDAGAFTAGTAFNVTGDGLHTFSYYSVDNANNTETTRVSNQFRIDTVAPVTTNSALGGTTYNGAQTFTLLAADTGGSGVASTWYQLDGGTWTAGNSVAVAAPVSGSAQHTISWYSIDLATNQEVTKNVAFTVAAPVGTTTLSATLTTYSSNHAFAHFIFYDENGNVIGDWAGLDEHTSSYSLVVPAGHAYTMYVEWEPPDYETFDAGSAQYSVTAAQASPGATIPWVVEY